MKSEIKKVNLAEVFDRLNSEPARMNAVPRKAPWVKLSATESLEDERVRIRWLNAILTPDMVPPGYTYPLFKPL